MLKEVQEMKRKHAQQSHNVALYCQAYRSQLENEARLRDVSTEVVLLEREIEVLGQVASIYGTVAEDAVQCKLNSIGSTLNSALSLLFKDKPRSITIRKKLYKRQYPHITVDLYEDGVNTPFSLSGDGIGQVVSFIFLISLIEVTGRAKVLIMDEILHGVHASAKKVLGALLERLAEDGWLILCVEYGLDAGKQLEVLQGKDGAYLKETHAYYGKQVTKEEEEVSL